VTAHRAEQRSSQLQRDNQREQPEHESHASWEGTEIEEVKPPEIETK